MLSGVVVFLAKGGPVMVPLAICSVLALAVAIERAVTWFRLGSLADPEGVLARAADKGTKASDVYTALARMAYEKDDFAAAEQAFVKAVAIRDDGKTWFNLGVVRVRRDDLQGALLAFERAAQHPETKEQAAKEIEKVKAALKK